MGLLPQTEGRGVDAWVACPPPPRCVLQSDTQDGSGGALPWWGILVIVVGAVAALALALAVLVRVAWAHRRAPGEQPNTVAKRKPPGLADGAFPTVTLVRPFGGPHCLQAGARSDGRHLPVCRPTKQHAVPAAGACAGADGCGGVH